MVIGPPVSKDRANYCGLHIQVAASVTASATAIGLAS